MPVKLATTYGKTDYNVVLDLRQLSVAVNSLEASAAKAAAYETRIATLEQETRRLGTQVAALTQQVQKLINP